MNVYGEVMSDTKREANRKVVQMVLGSRLAQKTERGHAMASSS